MREGKMLAIFEEIQNQFNHANGGVYIHIDDFKNFYMPLINYYINDRERRSIDSYIIGIQGPQGVGKTVFATLAKTFLKAAGYRVETISVDDFYKSNDERLKISKKYIGNPFYQISRGMPGTHNHELLFETLKKAKAAENFFIPRFDKSLISGRGDIAKDSTTINKQLHFLILEGWCINMPSREDKFLSSVKKNGYVKSIFNNIDPGREHFKLVLKYLKKYQKIWHILDSKTFIFAKNISWTTDWRKEQEKKLVMSKGQGMSDKEVNRFVKPFIPFSYFIYKELVRNNNENHCLIEVGRDHTPKRMYMPSKKQNLKFI